MFGTPETLSEVIEKSAEDKIPYFDMLPNEMIWEILEFVNENNLCRLAQLCKRLRSIVFEFLPIKLLNNQLNTLNDDVKKAISLEEINKILSILNDKFYLNVKSSVAREKIIDIAFKALTQGKDLDEYKNTRKRSLPEFFRNVVTAGGDWQSVYNYLNSPLDSLYQGSLLEREGKFWIQKQEASVGLKMLERNASGGFFNSIKIWLQSDIIVNLYLTNLLNDKAMKWVSNLIPQVVKAYYNKTASFFGPILNKYPELPFMGMFIGLALIVNNNYEKEELTKLSYQNSVVVVIATFIVLQSYGTPLGKAMNECGAEIKQILQRALDNCPQQIKNALGFSSQDTPSLDV